MTWTEFRAARRLLTEETIGNLIREAQGAEDAAFAASRDALRD